ncbi:hypothetical protein [uncultured Sulfitobacter sp.]|uniref:hypothetical protein n=1 Tax=uncultured Sulfitobacter sp. TaxID=191468 RepID=UPI00261CD25F|nr:hypothetical protein [uncultured Sulfitobacter sp.]
MIDTGFFKWVWRFNALVIAAAVTLMLCIVIWEMTSSLRRSLFQPQTTNTLIAPIIQTDQSEEDGQTDPAEVRRYFGAPLEYSAGSPYALPLRVEQEYDNRGISKSSVGNTINYRIIDTVTQTSKWLFPKGNRLILDTMPVRFFKRGQPEQNLGMILSVVESDTNGDERLSTRDKMSLYLVDTDWTEATKITEGVRSVLRIHTVSPSQIDLIFNTDDGTHAARIDAVSGLIQNEQVVNAQE